MSSMIRALTFSALFVSVSSQQLETLTVRGLLRGAKDTALRHLFLRCDSSSEEEEEMAVVRYDVGLTVDVPDTFPEPALLVPVLESAIQALLPVKDPVYTFVATSVMGSPIGRTDISIPMTADVMQYYDCEGDCALFQAYVAGELAGTETVLLGLLGGLITDGEVEVAVNAALTAASMPTLTLDNAAIAGTLTVAAPTVTIEVMDE